MAILLVSVLTGDMISVGIVAVIACPEGFSLLSNHQDRYARRSESVAVNYFRIFVCQVLNVIILF